MPHLILIAFAFFASFAAFAGDTVTHRHHCPASFRDLALCVSYDFPSWVTIGEEEVPFQIEIYRHDGSHCGQRAHEDVEGVLSATLSKLDDTSELRHEQTVKLIRTATGRYDARGAVISKPGLWMLKVDALPPGFPTQRANLYVYVHPDER